MKRFLKIFVFSLITSFVVGYAPIVNAQSFFLNSYSVQVSTFDADYQAVLDRATSLGYTLPSVGQQIKQNILVLDLKAGGVWTLLDILYIYATDGSSDFATLNWKSPTTFQCTKVNSPTFTTNIGFNGNGSTSYLNTGWIPNTHGVNYTLNNCSYGGYINTLGQSNIDFGTNSSGRANFNARRVNVDNLLLINGVNSGSGSISIANSSNVGFYDIYRTVSTSAFVAKNGVNFQTSALTSTGRPTVSFYVGGENNAGALATPSNRQIGCFFAGASTNHAALYTAWNTYFTSL